MAMYTALVCLTKTSLQRFQLNDRAVVGHIYSIKSEDVAMVRSSELLAKLELEDLNLIVGGGGVASLVWACGARCTILTLSSDVDQDTYIFGLHERPLIYQCNI